MTIKEVEQQLVELKHRKPFVLFAIEMTDGQSVQCLHPGLAINETGTGFFGPDGGIVDVEFRKVRSIRVLDSEAAA